MLRKRALENSARLGFGRDKSGVTRRGMLGGLGSIAALALTGQKADARERPRTEREREIERYVRDTFENADHIFDWFRSLVKEKDGAREDYFDFLRCALFESAWTLDPNIVNHVGAVGPFQMTRIGIDPIKEILNAIFAPLIGARPAEAAGQSHQTGRRRRRKPKKIMPPPFHRWLQTQAKNGRLTWDDQMKIADQYFSFLRDTNRDGRQDRLFMSLADVCTAVIGPGMLGRPADAKMYTQSGSPAAYNANAYLDGILMSGEKPIRRVPMRLVLDKESGKFVLIDPDEGKVSDITDTKMRTTVTTQVRGRNGKIRTIRKTLPATYGNMGEGRFVYLDQSPVKSLPEWVILDAEGNELQPADKDEAAKKKKVKRDANGDFAKTGRRFRVGQTGLFLRNAEGQLIEEGKPDTPAPVFNDERSRPYKSLENSPLGRAYFYGYQVKEPKDFITPQDYVNSLLGKEDWQLTKYRNGLDNVPTPVRR